MEVVGIDKARNRIRELVDRIQAGPVTITRNGEAAAIMLAPEDYESLVATVELLANPDYHRQVGELKRSPAEYVSQADMEAEAAKFRGQ